MDKHYNDGHRRKRIKIVNVDTINQSCAYVLNSNARLNNKIPPDSSFYPKVFKNYELDKDEVVQLDFKM